MLRTLFVACGSLLMTLLLAEAVFRVLPVSTATLSGYHVDTEVMSYPPGHQFTVSTGWDLRNPQHLRANNLGFVSDIDFTPDPQAVALIGDSFVEASMLDDAARPARQLAHALRDRRPVYGMGSPGTALLDYGQRLRLARERLGVRDAVLWVDAGDARQSVCGQGTTHSRCLDALTLAPRTQRQPGPGALKRLARHSALLQYVFGQLKVVPAELARAVWVRQVPEPLAATASVPRPVDPVALQRAVAVVDAVVDAFFEQVSPYRDGRLVFVVDGRRSSAPSPGDLRDQERRHFIERLRAHRNVVVVDLEPVYARHLQLSRLSLEVGPYDAHLNALGVRLVMQEAAAALLEGSLP